MLIFTKKKRVFVKINMANSLFDLYLEGLTPQPVIPVIFITFVIYSLIQHFVTKHFRNLKSKYNLNDEVGNITIATIHAVTIRGFIFFLFFFQFFRVEKTKKYFGKTLKNWFTQTKNF